ncbi:hypothetical protein AXX17_ATUG02550 (mitochondrion) [Arabidopsis thaliana]|uniref:Uncharacterized protein n=1 Tax=Arabidopsis thaliana TaxID=3702 RepID=A0A178U7X5_ARATH|nr:hypothetical protein AXX17_ATUG02550 [Arabidopsis thaliana]
MCISIFYPARGGAIGIKKYYSIQVEPFQKGLTQRCGLPKIGLSRPGRSIFSNGPPEVIRVRKLGLSDYARTTGGIVRL